VCVEEGTHFRLCHHGLADLRIAKNPLTSSLTSSLNAHLTGPVKTPSRTGHVVVTPTSRWSANRGATPAAVERAQALWKRLDSRKRTIAAQMGELEALEDNNA
jgi:hypothetical protein